MDYKELEQDFNNIRQTTSQFSTRDVLIERVLGETQNYIEFLEEKYNTFQKIAEVLNQIEDSKKEETKKEILAALHAVFPTEG